MDAEGLQRLLNENLYAGDASREKIKNKNLILLNLILLFCFQSSLTLSFWSDLSEHSWKKTGFSLDLCKSLVALMDVSSTMKHKIEKRLPGVCVLDTCVCF